MRSPAQVLGMVDKILRERADDILDVGRAVRGSPPVTWAIASPVCQCDGGPACIGITSAWSERHGRCGSCMSCDALPAALIQAYVMCICICMHGRCALRFLDICSGLLHAMIGVGSRSLCLKGSCALTVQPGTWDDSRAACSMTRLTVSVSPNCPSWGWHKRCSICTALTTMHDAMRGMRVAGARPGGRAARRALCAEGGSG